MPPRHVFGAARARAAAQVLMVSKPIEPPWHDSGKNLVRDLALSLTRYTPRLMTTPEGQGHGVPGACSEAIYSDAGRYSPQLAQNLRVLGRLGRPGPEAIRHFFFAPNPRTSAAARAVCALHPGVRVAQTIMSVPLQLEQAPRLIFSTLTIALSEYTRHALQARGVSGVHRVWPGVPMDQPPQADLRDAQALGALRASLGLPHAAGHAVFTFPGDYQFSDAAFVFASAIERLLTNPTPDSTRTTFVFACRPKQPQSLLIEAALRQRLAPWVASGQVIFLGEVKAILAWLAASTAVVMPASSTYAKMDLPLVLIEAMREARPIIVSDHGPLPELLGQDDAGQVVPTSRACALAQAMMIYLRHPQRAAAQGQAARARAERCFDARDLGPRHEALYDDLLAGRLDRPG